MPVGFVFDVERLKQLRRSPQKPATTLDVQHPSGRERRIRSSDDWRVRGFRIESRVLDSEGSPTSERIRTQAMVVGRDPLTGEQKPVRATITIVGWEDVVVYGDEPLRRYRPLTAEDAVSCGHVTVDGLRAAWREEHPSAVLARLYTFMLGDRRDQTVWVASGGIIAGRSGDYTTSRVKALDPDAPLLSDLEYDLLSMSARQKDAARRARISASYATESLGQRARRLAA